MNGLQIPLSLQRSRSSTAFLFNPSLFTMPSAILIAYIVCFSIGLVSSTKLLYRDAMPHSIVETNGTSRAATSKERFVAAAFDLAQVFLFVNDITAIAIAIASTSHFKWIDLSITSTLQLLTSMNVRAATCISQTANHSLYSLCSTSRACLWTVLLRIFYI